MFAIMDNGNEIGRYPTFEAAGSAHAALGFLGTVVQIEGGEGAKAEAPLSPEDKRLQAVSRKRRSAREAAQESSRLLQIAHDRLGIVDSGRTFFPPGTEMIEAGKAKFRAYAADHDQMPTFEDAAAAFVARIQGEHRKDAPCDIGALSWGVDQSKLTVARSAGKPAVFVEEHALRQIVARMTTGDNAFGEASASAVAAFLLNTEADIAAEALNRHGQRYAKVVSEKSRIAKLRLRRVNGRPQVFAAVGMDFPLIDADVLIREAYMPHLKGTGARGIITYQPATTRTDIRFSWHAPVEFDAHVGDVFRVGGRGTTFDAGNGSHWYGVGMTRIVCINCTIIELKSQREKDAHRGKEADILKIASERIADTANGVEEFQAAWGTLGQREISSVKAFANVEDPADALRKLASMGALAGTARKDKLVDALLDAYDVEPGNTLRDLLNAVTRAAHDSLLDDIEQWNLERAAGQLVPIWAAPAA